MGEAQIDVRWASDPHDVSAALALREHVFCVEQGVPRTEEIDRLDEQAMHIVALAPDEPRTIGTLRLLLLGDEAKLGRVAVARQWRRRGIATRMIDLALARTWRVSCSPGIAARRHRALRTRGLRRRVGAVQGRRHRPRLDGSMVGRGVRGPMRFATQARHSVRTPRTGGSK
jgi:GNAT superfamily N-acetyltransferase